MVSEPKDISFSLLERCEVTKGVIESLENQVKEIEPKAKASTLAIKEKIQSLLALPNLTE